MHTTRSPSPDHSSAHIYSIKAHNVKVTECTPCTSDLRSYEIDYDEVSESASLVDSSHQKRGRTAKGNEISPVKMPLMRIRSVEIVFEDEMSTCTNTVNLDRSIELVSVSSDDSTKCVDDLEQIHEKDDNDYSITLNAEGDLSDDTSISSKENIISEDYISETPQAHQIYKDSVRVVYSNTESLIVNDDTMSLNFSEIGDSGRFTEPSSSHIETFPIIAFDDALLSHSCDAINKDETSTMLSMYDLSEVYNVTDKDKPKLYEYIESNSDSSDDTAICDGVSAEMKILTSFNNVMVSDDEDTVCDSYDLQYDSFVDMGKF